MYICFKGGIWVSKRIKLRIIIEKLREVMHNKICERESIGHYEVVKISQELDKMLNEYNRMLVY